MKVIHKPLVALLASTEMRTNHSSEAEELLQAVGAGDWETDAVSDAETLVEFAGRLCYRSYKPGLNKNVTRVREGNKPYLDNILKSGHGSVLEHGTATFAFVGVSRVFTHELVRHRHGSYSQESLRFVRLDDLTAYYPKAFSEEGLAELFLSFPETLQDDLSLELETPLMAYGDPVRQPEADATIWGCEKARYLERKFHGVFRYLEDVQKEIAEELHLDEAGNFPLKKKITSAMRRLAPEGLGTAIVMTTNHRAWRDIIERRTSRHAEEEIRLVFGEVARQLQQRYPALYQDMRWEKVEGFDEVTFAHGKV